MADSENNQGSGIVGPAVGLYGIGRNLAYLNPTFGIKWGFFTSGITKNGGAERALFDFLSRGGIPFNEKPFDIAPNSLQGIRGTLEVNKFNGLQAVLEYARDVKARYGKSL
jgi:hypothetical protein